MKSYAAMLETYLRTGESDGLRQAELMAGLHAHDGGYALPSDWFGEPSMPVKGEKSDLYAMPAATAALLEDKSINIRDWIITEAAKPFAEQRTKLPESTHNGHASILRDPFSAKPYILFYVTLSVFKSSKSEAA